jgi:hypothetical protein
MHNLTADEATEIYSEGFTINPSEYESMTDDEKVDEYGFLNDWVYTDDPFSYVNEASEYGRSEGFHVVEAPTDTDTRKTSGDGLIGVIIGHLEVLKTAPRQNWKTANAEYVCRDLETGEFVQVRGTSLKRSIQRKLKSIGAI